jgi:hypothetical protein
MRYSAVVLSRLQNLSVEELDWLPHPDANSIGALLMHLAAADVYYGLNSFDGRGQFIATVSGAARDPTFFYPS